MSLEQHSIDQTYKARLSNLEVAPPAHAWVAIAAQLPNEKSDKKGFWLWGSGAASAKTSEEKSKRERVIFWWWTGALVALTLASLLAYYAVNTSSPQNNPTPSPQPAALTPIAASTEINTNEIAGESSTAEKTSIILETAEPSFSSKSKTSSTRTNSTETTRPTPLLSASVVSTQTARLTPTFDLSSKKEDENETGSNTAVQLLTDTKADLLPPTEGQIGISMKHLNMLELPINTLTSLETGANKLPYGPGVGCPDFNNATGWSFAVRVFAGPGTIFQEYTSTDQTAGYAELRESIETKQLSAHAGLRFEAVNDLGLFLRAGLDYQMYRTNVEYLGPPSSRTVIDSVFMEDTQTWRVETRNETYQEQRNVYNRQHAIVFTGGVGFRKTFGNISPYIMAEAGYEILIKRKGSFVLPDGNFVDLAEDDQGLYINDRPGLQFGGVIGVDFALTDRIEVGVSGHYKRLGGLRGSADLLNYDQSTAFGALNLRYTIQ